MPDAVTDNPQPQSYPTILLPDRAGQPWTPLDMLEQLSFYMDRKFEVPGTGVRFGYNSLLLMVPILGDLIPTLISSMILILAVHFYRIPRIVVARMILNTITDAALSAIPGLGLAWDVYFKNDTRNVKLLREYADTSLPATGLWKHWLFVLGYGAAVLAIVVGVAVGMAWLGNVILRAIQG